MSVASICWVVCRVVFLSFLHGQLRQVLSASDIFIIHTVDAGVCVVGSIILFWWSAVAAGLTVAEDSGVGGFVQ